MIVFACFSPHPPLLLPHVGSPQDKEKVKKTLASLHRLARILPQTRPEAILISSPHPDWGFNVPLHFLTANLPQPLPIHTFLTSLASPREHFDQGQKLAAQFINQKLALIASGDMSHRLKKDGPYGLHPSGAKFDRQFIDLLSEKNLDGILKLDPRLTEEAGECGLRSFCFALGFLTANRSLWRPKILSYESPFGVGYLVASLVGREKITTNRS